jgi:general secretion pathway protein H
MKVMRGGSSGFTLIELLVVMGIMGVIFSVAFVAKPKSASARVVVAARAVASSMQLARAQAMSKNIETVIFIDATKREFGQRGYMHGLPRGMAIALTVAETERNRNIGGLRFYPDGQSSGGDILLSLEGQRSSIRVNWLTGEARIL